MINKLTQGDYGTIKYNEKKFKYVSTFERKGNIKIRQDNIRETTQWYSRIWSLSLRNPTVGLCTISGMLN